MICCCAPRLGFSFVDSKAKRDNVIPTISRKMKVITANNDQIKFKDTGNVIQGKTNVI